MVPLRGLASAGSDTWPFWQRAVDYAWHMALPTLALVIGGFAGLTMLTKNSFLDEIGKQYVVTARAKGNTETRVLYGHVFRNAMLLIIAGFPAAFIGILFTGALLVRVAPRELLLNGLSSDTLTRYRMQLLADGMVFASTSASDPPQRAPIYSAALSPLPSSITLQASAFRLPSRLAGRALIWLVGGLAVAVGIALLALLRYTTQLVRTDRALVAETSLRRAMEDSLATGLRVLDRHGTIRYVNKAFCQMTGWRESQLVGRGPPFPYWPPEDHFAHRAKLDQILAGEVDASGFEVLVQRPDGSRFDARMYVSPLVDDSGAQIGWVTSMADITEPKRIRNELAAAHDRFTTVLESLEAAVSVVAPGPDGRDELLFANRAYQQEFGQQPDGHHRLAAELARGEPTTRARCRTATPAAGTTCDCARSAGSTVAPRG